MYYLSDITSNENLEFLLQIVIESEHTFADFHNCIQDACGYKADQMASFLVLKNRKSIEISTLDSGTVAPWQVSMETTFIKQLISSAKGQLVYVFDLSQSRAFHIQLKQIDHDKIQKPYLKTIKGNVPAQVLDEMPGSEIHEIFDYGDLDDYNEIYGITDTEE